MVPCFLWKVLVPNAADCALDPTEHVQARAGVVCADAQKRLPRADFAQLCGGVDPNLRQTAKQNLADIW